MAITIPKVTPKEFRDHIQAGGHIKYATIQWINHLSTSRLISTDSNTEFYYSFKPNNEVMMKRMRFGHLSTILFKLEFVELLNQQENPPTEYL